MTEQCEIYRKGFIKSGNEWSLTFASPPKKYKLIRQSVLDILDEILWHSHHRDNSFIITFHKRNKSDDIKWYCNCLLNDGAWVRIGLDELQQRILDYIHDTEVEKIECSKSED